MISTRRIAQLAKKWQRKHLTLGVAAAKGHCAVYTADGVRFEVPLASLGTKVFAEILRMSQEEFGFSAGDGRITLPLDAAVMEYAMCLLRRGAAAELEQAFLSTMVMPCHYARGVAPYVAACC